MKSYGESMREARLAAKLEASELAEVSGVSESTIRNYEKSERLLTLINIIALADTLGLTIDEYIGHEKQEARTWDMR